MVRGDIYTENIANRNKCCFTKNSCCHVPTPFTWKNYDVLDIVAATPKMDGLIDSLLLN